MDNYSEYLRKFREANLPKCELIKFLSVIQKSLSISKHIDIGDAIFALMAAGFPPGRNPVIGTILLTLNSADDDLSYQQQFDLLDNLIRDLS